MVRSYSRSRSRSFERRKRSRSRSASRSRSPETYRVHISELGIDPSQSEIERAFGRYGEVQEVWLARAPPCFAFAVYKNRDEAETAIRMMDGQNLCGGRIRVSWAKPRTRGHRRRGFDPNLRCYQCGGRGHFSRDCDRSGSSFANKGYHRNQSPDARRSRNYDNSSRGYYDRGPRDFDRRNDRSRYDRRAY